MDNYSDLSYCKDCPYPFKNDKEKEQCALHWRPQTGTKVGFPTEDGDCPKNLMFLMEKRYED